MENESLFEQRMLDLKQDNHLFLIYDEGSLEQMPSPIPFIKEGLESDERFIYISKLQIKNHFGTSFEIEFPLSKAV